MKMVIVGIILTVIVLVPRFVPSLSKPVAGPQSGAQTGTQAGTQVSVTGGSVSENAASVPQSTVGGPAVSKEDFQALKGQIADLKKQLDAVDASVLKEKEEREAAVREFNNRFRDLLVNGQIADYQKQQAAGDLKVPEWAVPWCHKASLDSDDLAAFYKLGCGMVHPSSKDDPDVLEGMLSDYLIFFLNSMKLSSLRLYRESSDHATRLSDLVPPEKRSENAPQALPVSSVNLNGTLQCKYSVDDGGRIKILGALYSIPKGELVHKSVKSGSDYQQVIKELAKEFAGLSEKLSSEVSSN